MINYTHLDKEFKHAGEKRSENQSLVQPRSNIKRLSNLSTDVNNNNKNQLQ